MENLSKEEREKLHEQEKINLINREKNKKLTKKIIFLSLTLIIIGSLIYLGIVNAKKPGKYDNFAKCLTEKNIKEYGAFWCQNCAEQKKLFGKSFKYVNYIECDPRGDNAQSELCQQENITGYPTWSINNTKYPGIRSLEDLSELSDCNLNS